MSLRRAFHLVLGSLAALSLLSGCPDSRSPKPPPRIPQPKVEHEAVDPLQTAPARHPATQQV